MPWELVADFVPEASLAAPDVRWGGIATALVRRMLDIEPRLRVILRNLPKAGTTQILRLSPGAMNPLFHGRLEIPAQRSYLVRQYFCKTCGVEKQKKDGKLWFPQMYLPLHKGHDIVRTPPTGRAERHAWTPTYRMFFGSAERLAGMHPGLPAVAVTTVPKVPEGLARFDWIFTVDALIDELVQALKRWTGAEVIQELPRTPAAAAAYLVEWIKTSDPKALDPIEPALPGTEIENTEEETAQAEEIKKRVLAAQRMIAARVGAPPRPR